VELSNELRVDEGLRMDELGRGEAMVDIARWFLRISRAKRYATCPSRREVVACRSSVLSRDRH
jgi:hypothetical protein